jgi:hypothetical protein
MKRALPSNSHSQKRHRTVSSTPSLSSMTTSVPPSPQLALTGQMKRSTTFWISWEDPLEVMME